MEYSPGRLYPQILEDQQAVLTLGVQKLLTDGYTSIRLKQQPQQGQNTLPFDLVLETFEISAVPKVEQHATFLLLSAGKPKYVVINGYIHDIDKPINSSKTGWLFK
jgi:hypothetical protein